MSDHPKERAVAWLFAAVCRAQWPSRRAPPVPAALSGFSFPAISGGISAEGSQRWHSCRGAGSAGGVLPLSRMDVSAPKRPRARRSASVDPR